MATSFEASTLFTAACCVALSQVQGRLCVDDVAQLCQPAVLGGCHAVERLEHQTVGIFIEIELNAHPLGIEHLAHGRGRRHGDDHTVVLHITHLPHEVHVSEHL